METIKTIIKWTGLFLLTFLLFLLTVLLLSCEQPTNTNLDPKDEPNNTPQPYRSTQEDREIYEALLGKWQASQFDNNKFTVDPNGPKIEFKSDCVIIENITYPINIETDIFQGTKKPGIDYSIHQALNSKDYFFIQVDKSEDMYIELKYKKNNINTAKQSINGNYIEPLYLACFYSRIMLNNTYNCADFFPDDSFIYIGPGDSSNSGTNPTEIIGTYRFTTATGTQSNGSITLNEDKTWTYKRDNGVASITNLTYTTSSNTVTMKWVSNGMDLEETYTLTTDGADVTWTTSNQTSNLFLTLFSRFENAIILSKE